MISIVIPTYNEAAFIGTLLASLTRQEMAERLELVVADNASTDRTCEIVQQYAAHFSELLIVKGGTPAEGRNSGALASQGDPIVFLDADLELREKTFLARNVSFFRARKLAAGSVRLVPMSYRTIDRAMVGFYNLILWPAVFIRPLGSMCIFASRTAFESTQGYPEDVAMAEDHDFVLRCSRFGKYRIMPASAYFSVRRLDKEGRFGLARKYLRATALRVFRGPILSFDYEFGYSKDSSTMEGGR
jgi:glycosyltransferase involved in cell wall biosynthesis